MIEFWCPMTPGELRGLCKSGAQFRSFYGSVCLHLKGIVGVSSLWPLTSDLTSWGFQLLLCKHKAQCGHRLLDMESLVTKRRFEGGEGMAGNVSRKVHLQPLQGPPIVLSPREGAFEIFHHPSDPGQTY